MSSWLFKYYPLIRIQKIKDVDQSLHDIAAAVYVATLKSSAPFNVSDINLSTI